MLRLFYKIKTAFVTFWMTLVFDIVTILKVFVSTKLSTVSSLQLLETP